MRWQGPLAQRSAQPCPSCMHLVDAILYRLLLVVEKTVWDIWNAFDEVTPAFCTLASMPSNIDGQIEVLEHFVVILYDRTSSEVRVNDARKHLFCQKSRPMDGLPPTQSALIEHTKRAAYQAGHIWAQMLVTVPKLPSPGEWGWQETNNGWEVEWTTLPEASKACRELLRCGCQKGCRRQCKCVKAVLQCTALCQCRGLCERDWCAWLIWFHTVGWHTCTTWLTGSIDPIQLLQIVQFPHITHMLQQF